MADPRFYARSGTYRLFELAERLNASLSEDADPQKVIEDVAPLDQAAENHLSFLDNPKYVSAFSKSKAGACLVHPKHAEKAPKGMALLLSEAPYLAYARAAALFYPFPVAKPHIAKQAYIDESARVGEGCEIGPGVYIGPRVVLGARCIIQPNVTLLDGVTIGDETQIGANTVISYAMIGNRVIIHPGAKIGQDGFGFAAGDTGAVKVPQLGRVIIEDDVEIGANTCIDRGAGPDTVIMRGAKIDNLVQIGHNVRVGRFVTLVSQVGISGSASIGDGAVLAGQVGVAGHLKVGARAVLAAKSGVTNHVPDGASYGGFPAIPVMEWRRQVAALTRLIKKKDKPDD